MKYIIDFKDHLTQQQINDHITGIGGSIVKTFNAFNKTYLVECMVPPQLDSALHEHIIDDENEPLQLLSTTIISDQTWGTRKLDGPTITVSTSNNNDWWKNYVISNAELDKPSYTIDKRGQGYTVYVLDSGCELSHPEFDNRPVSNLFSFNNDFTDTNGHGTAIASVITGNTCGVTEATVKSVKIFDNSVSTKQSDLINALDAIANDFATNNSDFAVVNCSWTISKNLFIESKLQSLINMGMIVVAAAGNSGVPIENVTPASMDSVITIGSFNSNLEPSNFSNYTGSSISLTQNQTNSGALDGWAPGEQIYCATLNGTYGLVAGTSIAAGIHSAVCAYNLELFGLDYNINSSIKDYTVNSSLSRQNLLNLQDPKYASSANKVSTIVDKVSGYSSGQKFGMSTKVYSNEKHSFRIFDNQKTISLEILSDLPTGYEVKNRGILIGTAPEVMSVTTYSVSMRVTTVDNQIHDFNFELYVMPNGFDPQTQSTGDPILDLKLQVVVNCQLGGCETIDGCNDNCAGLNPGYFCDLQANKSCTQTGFYCQCTPP